MRAKTMRIWLQTAAIIICLCSATVNEAQALPVGGQIVSGSASIDDHNGQLTVRQNTARLISNWAAFSIAQGESVRFFQPSGGSICLIRVVGGKPSEIFGSLSANGKIFLINSNGILFGAGSSVNTGGLVASTMQLTDQDFLAGRYRFRGGRAAVVNQGVLRATNGGYLMLLAPTVENGGTIAAERGQVVLGAGGKIVLALQDSGLIQVQIDPATVAANVKNSGRIAANGGSVLLSAQGGGGILAGAVNHQGIIEAKRLNGQGGSIVLDSGEQGRTTVNGVLSAVGGDAQQNGGTVSVLGKQVALLSGSRLEASGKSGGTLLIGGNRQGQGPERNAQQTNVESGAVLTADAIGVGDGGNVVVWSNGSTLYQGTISARGGDAGGNGGQAEVSGKAVLDYQGSVDLRAPRGTNGELLLDPKNIYIVAAGGDPAGNTAFVDNSGGDTKISGVALANALNMAAVHLQADNDIQFLDDVAATANNSLHVESGRSIIFDNNARVTLQGDVFFKVNSENAQIANRDTDSAAVFKMWNGTALSSGNGKIQLATGTFGTMADGAVEIKSGAQISSSGGNIEINAISRNRDAIVISGGATLRTTNGGSVSLNGTANGDLFGGGVRGLLVAGALNTVNGDLTLRGMSNGALQQNNSGVELDGAMLRSQGARIVIAGAGGIGNGDKNFGVLVGGASRLDSDTGIFINGTARSNGVSGHGILLDSAATITANGSGIIELNGNGAAGVNNNYGIQLKGGASIASSNGDIRLNGSGGASSGEFNPGIVLTDGATIAASGTGNVVLAGTGGNATNDNSGIYLKNAAVSVNSGRLQMTGVGNGIGQGNAGVWLDQNVNLQAGTQGSVLLTGVGSGSGHNNAGVKMANLQVGGGGALTIDATGGAAMSPDVDCGGLLQSAGDIALYGRGGAPHRAALGQVQAGGKLTLAFDEMPTATQLYGEAGVAIQPYTPGLAISIGSGSNGLVLRQEDLDLLTTSGGKNLQIGSPQTGTVTVNSGLNQGSRNVMLQTGADIVLNSPIVTSGTLELDGSSGANTFFIGAGQIGGMGKMTIHGGGGADCVTLNDSANLFDSNYRISAALLQGKSNGQQVEVEYQGVANVTVRAGSGRVNSVESELLAGVRQQLSGGNSNASILHVDCHGVQPQVTATQIQGGGFAPIVFDGFKTVVLTNVPPAVPVSQPTNNMPFAKPSRKLADNVVVRQIEYPQKRFNEVDEQTVSSKQIRYLLQTTAVAAAIAQDVEIIIINEGIAVPH